MFANSSQICGLDEAGRGALAGPLVAAAVVFPASWRLEMANPDLRVRDSKLLTVRQRLTLYEIIRTHAVAVDLEVISVHTINRRGIGWVNRTAFTRLIRRNAAARYLCDGNLKLSGLGERGVRTCSIIRADGLIPSVIAAGIVAKVTRDRLMRELHQSHPHFNWHTNVGYGTRRHLEALSRHGPTSHHRALFVTTALKNFSSAL